MAMSAYTKGSFPPVLSNSTDIRVLKLEYNDWDSPDLIVCKFKVVSLDDKVPYTALSYVWGNDSQVAPILIDRTSVEVRGNLWQFLRLMQKEKQTEYFWVDALCINQTDLDERSSQVAMMGRVCSSAAKVIVWLGIELVEVDGLRYFRHEKERMLAVLNAYVAYWRLPQSDRGPKNFPRYCYEALRRLLENTYWSRAWIMQEFLLARELELRCGPDRMSEDNLLEIYQEAYTPSWTATPKGKRSRPPDFWLKFRWQDESNMQHLIEMRQQYKGNSLTLPKSKQANSIFSMLGLPAPPPNTQCLDPRDRIYSLLSLADPKKLATYPIYPDYAKPPTDLLIEIVYRDSRRIFKKPQLITKSKGKDRDPVLEGLKDRVLQLAQLLEIPDPLEASLYAVEKALANVR
jgi:hypothetical protein